jgi:hypothetical protein
VSSRTIFYRWKIVLCHRHAVRWQDEDETLPKLAGTDVFTKPKEEVGLHAYTAGAMPARGGEEPTPTDDTQLTEDRAQAAFADVYDGDYGMHDLMERSSTLAHAIIHLYALFTRNAAGTRTVTFTATSGPVELQRPARPPASMVRRIAADQITVSVRDGRVVRIAVG